jgi:hypothetical protein
MRVAWADRFGEGDVESLIIKYILRIIYRMLLTASGQAIIREQVTMTIPCKH